MLGHAAELLSTGHRANVAGASRDVSCSCNLPFRHLHRMPHKAITSSLPHSSLVDFDPVPPLRFAPIQFPSPRSRLEFPESSIPGIAGAVCGAVQSYFYHGAVSKCCLASLVSFDLSIFRVEISLCLFQSEEVVPQFLDLFIFG